MNPEHAVVEFLGPLGNRVGMGFVDAGDRIRTCAHVVNTGIGRGRNVVEHPREPLTVRFPFATAPTTSFAHVTGWGPRGRWEAALDHAVLDAAVEIPKGVGRLSVAEAPAGAEVQVCGPGDDGALDLIYARVAGQRARGRHHLHQAAGNPMPMEAGCSGGPVWLPGEPVAVGVVRAASRNGRGAECLALAEMPARPARTPGVVDVLHVRAPALDAVSGPLRIAGLCADIAHMLQGLSLAPDVVTIAGDLTTDGRRGQFALAALLRSRLLRLLELEPGRVVTVPGRADVNAALCRAHFERCAAMDEVPVPPYAEKWELYSGFDALGAEPWRYARFPELGLTVLGLNATMPVTHDCADLAHGDQQLTWFAAELAADGHRRIAVTAGGDGHGLPVDLSLAGGEPGYQLIRLETNRLSRWERARGENGYRDVAHPSAELVARAAPATAPPPRPRPVAPSRNLELVRSSLLTAHPDARLTVASDGVERVHVQPKGGGEFLVGVIPHDVTTADVDVFKAHWDHHLGLPAHVPGKLVHFGGPADMELRRYASRRNISLLSYADFHHRWDPRPFVRRQLEHRSRPGPYAPRLFIPPLHVDPFDGEPAGDDLLDQILDLLDRDGPRFICVIGDGGTGKTSLLWELTRRLSGDGGLTPILLELRALNKAASFTEWIASALARGGGDVTMERFLGLMHDGHVVAILDGLDELAARGDPRTSADELTGLLDLCGERGKVVVSSRDTVFASRTDLLGLLGGGGAAIRGHHVFALDGFSPAMALDSLQRLLGPGPGAERYALIGASAAAGLARNPRMLRILSETDPSVIADADRLLDHVTTRWLAIEKSHINSRYSVPAMEPEALQKAVIALAAHLRATGASGLTWPELVAFASGLTASDVAEHAHQLAGGSLLVRSGDDRLAFIDDALRDRLAAHG